MENIELSDVCYEQIKETFYYGIFGDFKLVIDKATGYFNATKLCVEGGKEFRLWSRSEKTKKLVEYYQKNRPDNYPVYLTYEIRGSNKDKIEKQITGTYVSKELILDIGSWVSIEFYDRCNNIIINYFVKKFKSMDHDKLKQKIKEVEELTKNMEKLTLEKNEEIKVKDDKIDELKVMLSEQKQLILKQDREREKDREYMRSLGISLEEVKEQNEELLDDNKDLKKKADNIQRKLGIAVEDREPLPADEKKRERFILL
jgi:hypothetical protein